MALDTQLSDRTVNVQADALSGLLRGGFIDVMTGPKPQTCDTPIENQMLLVTMRFSDPAFSQATSGVIISEPIIQGKAVAEGSPSWFRAYGSDHTTPIFDGSVGMTKANMILPVRMLVPGMSVGCGRVSHTVAKSTLGV